MIIEPKDINSIGLLFDIAGAWLVATEVVKQFKGTKYEKDPTWDGLVKPPFDSAEYRKWEASKFRFMWIGLFCLTVGFSLQIISNYLSSNHINICPSTSAANPTTAPP